MSDPLNPVRRYLLDNSEDLDTRIAKMMSKRFWDLDGAKKKDTNAPYALTYDKPKLVPVWLWVKIYQYVMSYTRTIKTKGGPTLVFNGRLSDGRLNKRRKR